MNYIDYTEIKQGDYIVAEIGTWWDDNDNEHKNGICLGHVINYDPEQWDDEDESYHPVFNCSRVIYADNSIELNNVIGVLEDTKYRYMTDKEIEYFNARF